MSLALLGLDRCVQPSAGIRRHAFLRFALWSVWMFQPRSMEQSSVSVVRRKKKREEEEGPDTSLLSPLRFLLLRPDRWS